MIEEKNEEVNEEVKQIIKRGKDLKPRKQMSDENKEKARANLKLARERAIQKKLEIGDVKRKEIAVKVLEKEKRKKDINEKFEKELEEIIEEKKTKEEKPKVVRKVIKKIIEEDDSDDEEIIEEVIIQKSKKKQPIKKEEKIDNDVDKITNLSIANKIKIQREKSYADMMKQQYF